jgi:hypothetical protein
VGNEAAVKQKHLESRIMSAVESFRSRSKIETPVLSFPPGNSFMRIVTARAIASVTHRSPAEVAGRLWPTDATVLRAASAPAMTSVTGWAAELAHKVVEDAPGALGPLAACAQFLRQCLVLTWDGNGLISVPGFVAGAGNAGFVAEGNPIPVRQLASSAALLQPYKLAAIGVLTREMLESSNAERLIGDVLMRAAAAALDAVLFGTAASSAAAPAGLRNGIAALTASTATDLSQAFYSDVSALINATSVVGGAGPYVFIGNPGLTTQMIMRFLLQANTVLDEANVIALGSNAMGNDLMCVAADGVVAALSPNPVIETANAGELHMNDTPLAIVNGGAPAAPARSLFQTDSIALKMRWPVTWAVRDARAVAWLTPAWR